jgi:hypothetical protein
MQNLGKQGKKISVSTAKRCANVAVNLIIRYVMQSDVNWIEVKSEIEKA